MSDTTSIKVALDIVPNGINKDGDLRFGIIIGLDSEVPKDITRSILKNLGKDIDEWIDPNKNDDNRCLAIHINDQAIPYALDRGENGIGAFANQNNNWDSLFSAEKKIMLLPFEETNKLLERNNEKDIKFLFDNNSSKLFEAENEDEYLTNLVKLENIDKEFEQISEQAEKFKTNKDLLTEKIGKKELPPDNKIATNIIKGNIRFHKILSAIYQHPHLANRHYGLLINVTINPTAVKDYINKEKTSLKLNLTKPALAGRFRSPYSGKVALEAIDGQQNNLLSEFNDYCIIEKEINENTKRYHGKENFGIVKFPENAVKWENSCRIQMINHRLKSLEEMKRQANHFKKEQLKYRTSPTEGIIAYLNSKVINTTKYKELFQKKGICGHNIVTIAKRKFNSKLYSLCKREVTYIYGKKRERGKKILKDNEEGILKIDAALETADADIISNELFKWEGQNLCVPKYQHREDQEKEEDQEKTKKRGLDDEAYKFIEDYGFQYDYRLVKGSNLILMDGRYIKTSDEAPEIKISFLVREVGAVTGHCLPLDSENKHELNLKDIYSELLDKDRDEASEQTGKHKFILDYIPKAIEDPKYEGFKVLKKHDPIDAPFIVSNSFEQDEHKAGKQIVLTPKHKHSKWVYIYPPKISLQMAHFLGYFDPALAANTNEYLDNSGRIYKKSIKEYPKKFYDDSIKYLTDKRASHLLIVPNNWKTWKQINGGLRVLAFNNKYPISLIIEKGKKIVIPEKVDSYKIKFSIPENTELEFRLYTYDGQLKTNDDEKIQPGDYLNYNQIVELAKKYCYDTIKISHVNKKVGTPEIIDKKFWISSRFLHDGERKNYTYYGFKLTRNIIRKNLYLLSESNQIIDDGTNIANLIKKKEWLKDEYDRSVFSQKIINEETGIYLNNFGVAFKFKVNFLINRYKRIVKEDEAFWELSINTHTKLQAIIKDYKNKENKISYSYKVINEQLNIEYDLLDPETKEVLKITTSYNNVQFIEGNIILNYQFSEKDLELRIYYTYKNGKWGSTEDLFHIINLPSDSLSEADLKLNVSVEESLLFSKITKNHFDFNVYDFPQQPHEDKFKKTDSPEFFVYRNENTTKFLEKDIKLVATSKFANYFPNLLPGKSEFSNTINGLKILNNKKPEKPNMQLVPLLYHTHKKPESNEEIHSRDFQLLIEIDRPWSEDQLALIVSRKAYENKKHNVHSDTCAIGRDIIKEVSGKIDQDTNEDLFLDKYLTRIPGHLSKYFDNYTKEEDVDKKRQEIVVDGKEYQILPLNPYFDVSRDKWIVAIGFWRLGKLDDPFIRIVAARYQKNSVVLAGKANEDNKDYLKISEFTNPLYIPIQSSRAVQVREIEKNRHIITIMKNDKTENINFKNSIFIACYLKNKAGDPLQKELVPLKSDPNNYLIIDESEKTNELRADKIKRIDSINIFEIELHDNLLKDLLESLKDGKIDFINHPSLRIIYIEEFKT